MQQPLLAREWRAPDTRIRLISLALVVVLHLVMLYALITGLAIHLVENLPEELKAVVILARIESKTPVPPPPKLALPQPPYVPPPDVVIQTQTPPTNTITVQSTSAEPAAEASGPSLVPTEPVGNTHNCDSYYPPFAQRLSQEGKVMVRYTVGTNGVIGNVAVTKSSGFASLDQAALNCVRERWRNIPATENGKPVASTSDAYVSFVLRE